MFEIVHIHYNILLHFSYTYYVNTVSLYLFFFSTHTLLYDPCTRVGVKTRNKRTKKMLNKWMKGYLSGCYFFFHSDAYQMILYFFCKYVRWKKVCKRYHGINQDSLRRAMRNFYCLLDESRERKERLVIYYRHSTTFCTSFTIQKRTI